MGNDYRNDKYMSEEQRAKEQAYQEYLSLREHRSSRGHYVKDDTLYGEYFANQSNTSHHTESGHHHAADEGLYYDQIPSVQKQKAAGKQQDPQEAAREEYLRQRAEAAEKKQGKRERIAVAGSRNKADYDNATRAEKKAARKSQNGGGRGRKKGRGLKVALIVVLVLVLGIGGTIAAGLTVVKNTLDNVGRVELDPDLIGINPQVDSDLRNYRNIALLGIDARDMSNDEGTRSDAMIVASINKETNEIRMFSVYRDTLLDIGDQGLDKITHAYYYGGPTRSLYALNKNLDLNIKEVVVVNWKAVADAVDELGGLDIEIQESEINEMNKYIKDTQKNIGGSKKKIEKAGKQTLNGVQAVTYARIRKDALTGDYRRNERMKIVVQAAFDKAKNTDVRTLKKIAKDILPEVKTNMSSADMMGMLLKVNSYSMTKSNVGWPYETRGWTGAAWYGPPVTLTSNVKKLHEEFFGQSDYTPTQDVQNISERISAMTGYY